jgi:ribonuclease R
VGTRVRVQVSRVDLAGRKIDFRMVRDAEGERPLIRGDRGAERAGLGKANSASEELALVQGADRAAKAAAKARKAAGKSGGKGGGQGAGKSGGSQSSLGMGSPGGATTHRSRKPGPQRPAPKPRSRR